METTMWYNAVGCFVTLALSLLVAPLAAAAPPAGKVPTIGVLTLGTATGAIIRANLEAFTQGLRALGYIEGQNIAIEPRYAEGRPERLPALAAELASLHVDVFVVGINRLAEVVQQTTTKIPIVMINAEEPVHFGLVQSLARPGGNITGLAVSAGPDWFGKNLEPTFKGTKRTWGIFLRRVLYPSPHARRGIPIGGGFWQKVLAMSGHQRLCMAS